MGNERYNPNNTETQFGANSQQHQDALNHQRERERQRRQYEDAWKTTFDKPWWEPGNASTSKVSGGSGNTSGTVICTECHRQGLMSAADCALSRRHLLEHLTPAHERGYHAWAFSIVRKMRRSGRWTRAVCYLAKARNAHIAYLYGQKKHPHLLGATLCAIGHPICYLIGQFVSSKNPQTLYKTEG